MSRLAMKLKVALPLIAAAVLCSCGKQPAGPQMVSIEPAVSVRSTRAISDTDPADAEFLQLNVQTDIDGSSYYAVYKDGMVNGRNYRITEEVDLASCRIDPSYAVQVGPHSFQWIAPSGKYAVVSKPEHGILYGFRIKGVGGDYDGWTPSAAGGTDKTGRGKRMMFMVGSGIGVCDRFVQDSDWSLLTPATLNQNGKVDGTNQPVMLNLETTDYSSTSSNRFSAIVKFSSDKPAEFGFCGCTNCVWPVNFGAGNIIQADKSISLSLGEKWDLGDFIITIPTLTVIDADFDSFYKVTVSDTQNGIDVIWANVTIEKF